MNRKSPGFTLIEIMIVLVILGLGLTLGISKMTNRSTDLRAVLRKMVVLSRELHIRSKLNGVTYRLVIDLDQGGPKSVQTVWVEKGNKASVITDSQAKKNPDEQLEAEVSKDFQRDDSLLKEPIRLPKGVYFREIELNRVKTPLRQGITYIHYLPQGLVEEAAIHLETDKNQKWTISIHPLTGRAEVTSPSMTLEQLRDQ